MKQKIEKRYRRSVLSRDPYKRRSEDEMIRIVKEVNSGIIAKRAACEKYGHKLILTAQKSPKEKFA